jgi:hypothetical protein
VLSLALLVHSKIILTQHVINATLPVVLVLVYQLVLPAHQVPFFKVDNVSQNALHSTTLIALRHANNVQLDALLVPQILYVEHAQMVIN